MIGILGGGLTGLTLARNLKGDSVILEKLPETGGLCRAIIEDGFTFDLGGSHIIFSKDKEVLDFMISVLGDNIVRNRRNTRILFKGRLVKYPFENGLSDLELRDNFECIFYFIANLISKNLGMLKEPANFKDYLYHVFGKGISEKYLIPYNEKIWNIKTEEMDYLWVKDRLPMPRLFDLLKSSLGIGSEGYVHQLFFYYPKEGGIHALTKSIENGTKSRIIVGYDIKSIRKVKGGFEVSDGKRRLKFPAIVSTIPLPDLIRIIKDPVPHEVREAARNLRFNSLINVMIGLDTPVLNDISWMYVPGEDDGELNRASFPFNFSSHTTPEGKTSVLAEITCQEGDEVWRMKDKALVKHVVEHLDRNKIIDRKAVCYSKVHRLKYAYVVYDKGHSKNKAVVRKFVDDYGIHLCGRFSEFDYYNMDKCIRSAINKAQQLNKVIKG